MVDAVVGSSAQCPRQAAPQSWPMRWVRCTRNASSRPMTSASSTGGLVGRHLGRPVRCAAPAQIRGDHPVARGHQRGDLLAPDGAVVRPPVQQQHVGAVALDRDVQGDPIGVDAHRHGPLVLVPCSPAADYDTLSSVMSAEPSPVEKAGVAGRPRDPRIDAAILRATAELLVEIGYANLSLATPWPSGPVPPRRRCTGAGRARPNFVHGPRFPSRPPRWPPRPRLCGRRRPRHAGRNPRRVHQPGGAGGAAGLIADMGADPNSTSG